MGVVELHDDDPRWRGTHTPITSIQPKESPSSERRLPKNTEFIGSLSAEETRASKTHQWILTEVTIIPRLASDGVVISREQRVVRGLLTIREGTRRSRDFAGVGIGTAVRIAEDLAFADALRNMLRCEALDRGETSNQDGTSDALSQNQERIPDAESTTGQ